MSQKHFRNFSSTDVPDSKCLHLESGLHALDIELTTDPSIQSSQPHTQSSYAPMPLSTPTVNKFTPHCLALADCATVNNAADTPYFSKHKALVFQFLDVSDVIENELGEFASCKLHCGVCGRGNWHWTKGGKAKGLTLNMVNHMKEKHPAIWSGAEEADNRAFGVTNIGTTGSSAVAEPTSPTAPKFHIDEFYKRLTRWIVTGNQPFTEIENEEFRDMLIYLCPALEGHLVRSTAIKDRIISHAGIAREHTKRYLSDLSGLMAVACDGWTSANRIAFWAITASWITSDWRLEETLLDFVELHGAHDGENMANAVATSLTELGIMEKVVALVSDNASNNGTLVRHLSNQLRKLSPGARWDGSKGHVRCLAHIIHLAVMRLLHGLHAIPESTNAHDFDQGDLSMTEEDAEAMVANDETESLKSDNHDIADITKLGSTCSNNT